MIWEDLKEELVLTDLDAESSGEVFERLGKTLIGKVTAGIPILTP